MVMSHGQVTVDFNNNGSILESNEPPTYMGDSQVSLTSSHTYGLPPQDIPGPAFFPPLQHQNHSYTDHAYVPQLEFYPYDFSWRHIPGPPLFVQESVCNLDACNELDVHTLQKTQHQHCATFVDDENTPTGLVDFQAVDNTQLYDNIYMQEQVYALPQFMCPPQPTYFSGALHELRNTPMSFPTLEVFSPPVGGLPKWPQNQPSCFPHSHPSHNGFSANDETDLDAGRYTESSNVMDPNTLAAWQSNAPYPLQVGDNALPMGFPDGVVADSHETRYPNGDASWEPLTFVPYGTATPPKRKNPEAVEAADDRHPGGRKYKRVKRTKGFFGKYAVADAKAKVMAKPLINHHPVDIRKRKTHDAVGNVLRTRHYGTMEIDDFRHGLSAPAAEELPPGLMCVRACEWTDKPCGLYLEMTKKRIEDHLLYWHDVKSDSPALCKFKGCSSRLSLISLGRHVATVHNTTSSKCDYCGEILSRSDSVTRHYRTCEVIQSAAESAGHAFKFKPPKTIFCGYIVPTK